MNSYTCLKPYFEASRKILDGIPVKNLDKIRQECNKQFLKNNICYGYKPKFIVASFAADAENKILLGKNPDKIYTFNGDPKSFREKSKKILEGVIKKYLV